MQRHNSSRLITILLLFLLMPACGTRQGNETSSSELKTAEDISQNLSGPRVFIELFPVYLSGGRPFVLIPGEEESWQFPLPESRQAHDLVQGELSALALEPVVIHSTSWRQDREKLLITYLAVILKPESTPDGYDAFSVAPSGLVRGKATAAPYSIPTQAVIHHALQHLAWLFQTDPVIRENLAGNWNEILRDFQAKPAANLDQGVPPAFPR